MNQDDFRRLLATGGGNDGERRSGGRREVSENDIDFVRKLSSKKQKKTTKKHVSNAHEKEVYVPTQPSSQYRDRAAERREGRLVEEDEIPRFDVAPKKPSGGTLAPEQAIKGLDLSLLRQLKQEKERLTQAKQQLQAQAAKDEEELVFKSRMGRLVYFHACQNQPQASATTKSELFLPGRMYYTFNVKSDAFNSIPAITQRSKEDCPEVDDVVAGLVDDLVISRIADALTQKRNGKKHRRKKDEAEEMSDTSAHLGQTQVEAEEKANFETDEPVAKEESDDEDIFADVGEYVPIYRRDDEEKIAAASGVRSNSGVDKQGYFTNLSASLTAAEELERKKAEEAEQAWKATLKKAVAAQSQAEREKEQKARLAKAMAEEDTYSECFPEYQAGAGYDSDDDDGGEGKKKRKEGDGKSGATDEVDSTEQQRRKKQKHSNKLDNDLQKINKLMDSKSR